MLNLVFISCIFSVGNGQFFSIYFKSIFHTELAKFEHANIAHSNPIQSAVNFIRILSWKLNPIATTDAQCDAQCGTISADIYIPQEKKGNFPQKVEMINENICNFSYGRHKFVLFAKHTNKHIFFHSQY